MSAETRRPRILCIAGSPRRHGNTDVLCDALEHGITAEGGEPVRLTVANMSWAPCRGCNACSSTGECVVRDAMDDVYPLLEGVDAIAVATPVYFASVPAQMKALIDRCQPFWARRYVLGEPAAEHRRPGAAIVIGGGGDPFGSDCAVTPLRSAMNVLGVSLDDVMVLTGLDTPGDAMRHPDAMARATELGERLVSRCR